LPDLIHLFPTAQRLEIGHVLRPFNQSQIECPPCELLDNVPGGAIDFVYHTDNTGAALLISIDSY
jgi:hypothetical protein